MSTSSPAVPLLREELVEASVLRAITTGLPDYGVQAGTNGQTGPTPLVVVREAFPTEAERASELQATTLAFGFNVDDGGTPAELGTNLTHYVHMLTAWVFALEPRFGRRIGYTMQHIARRNLDMIPLLDFNADPLAPPTIDGLIVLQANVKHEGNSSPRPWDKYVFTCTISVRDTYYVD